MEFAKIRARGQTTIPKKTRDAANLARVTSSPSKSRASV